MKPSSGWYVQQAKVNPDLFRVIYDFNCRPQFWLPSALMDGLPHPCIVRALAAATHGAGHLSAWLAKTLGLDLAQAEWDFEEPRRRLALLGPAALARLACFAGAALCWPQLAAIIGRTQIQEIKAALGDGAYSFALRRARMLVPQNEAAIAAGGEPLADHVISTGWQLLALAASDDTDAVQQRFMLKLPPEVAIKIARPMEAGLRARAWGIIRKITPAALSEGEYKCFA